MELAELEAELEQLKKRDIENKDKFLIAWFKNDYYRYKPEISNGKFLQVIFEDNNFTGDLEIALEFIWLNIHKNNSHLIGKANFSNRSVADVIVELHNHGKLKRIIERTWYLMYELHEVESTIDYLYDKIIDWEIVGNLLALDNDKTSYLVAEYKLHNNNEFTKEWQNGEHICWNLKTGKATSF